MQVFSRNVCVSVLGLLTPAIATPAMGSVLGYWTLDDAAPSTAASTIASEVNSAALDGVATGTGTGSAPIHVSDVPGLFVLDGLGGPVISANSTSLSFTSSGGDNGGLVRIDDNATDETLLDPTEFTLEFFFKAPTASQNFSVYAGRNQFTDSMGWGVGNYWRNNRIRISNNEVPDGGGFVGHSTDDNSYFYVDGDWHHFALTYDPDTTTLSFYGDYQLVTTLVQPIDYTDAGGNPIDGALVLGGLAGGNSLTGLIDEVRLSGTALDPDAFLRVSDVPEPASLALLGFGGAAMLMRRRA